MSAAVSMERPALPPPQRTVGGCPPPMSFVEVSDDALPLLHQPPRSVPAESLMSLTPADIESAQAPEAEHQNGVAPLDPNQVLRRAMQRPSVALLVAALLLCVAVCVGCWAMNLVGWIVLVSSLSCSEQADLRNWLLVYLVGVMAEVGILGLARICHYRLVQELDLNLGLGFVRACNVCFTLFASAVKIFWCVHAQVLVAAAKEGGGCGAAMPRFISAFSVVVLLRLLAVDTFLSLLAGLVLRFVETSSAIGSSGNEDIQVGGPARPGTLDALERIDCGSPIFSGTAEGGPLSKECCFCLEEYDEKQAIIVTPCRHTMHRGCLEKWLRKSHFCPICRGDLEDALQLS